MKLIFRIRLVLIFCVLFLSACSGLLGKPEVVTVFDLRAQLEANTQKRSDWQLLIAEPIAPNALGSNRIVIKQQDEFSVLAGVRWRDNTPTLWRSLLIEGFETDTRIQGLGRTLESVQSDYLLLTEIRDFQLQKESEGLFANVSISARLVRTPSNRVIANQVFKQSVKAQCPSTDCNISAFANASKALTQDVVDWTVRNGEQDQQNIKHS